MGHFKEIGIGFINILFVRIGSKKVKQMAFPYNLEIVVVSGRIVVGYWVGWGGMGWQENMKET